VSSDTVTLTGDVWFGYGQDEFEGETVIYSLRDERVRVNSGDSGRVRGIIRPRAREQVKGALPFLPPGDDREQNDELRRDDSADEGEA
jgi:lipopolysaccharide export system protein LptA